jgi:hypothetical protein
VWNTRGFFIILDFPCVHPVPIRWVDPAWIANPQPLRIRLFGKWTCQIRIVDFNISSNRWVSLLLMDELKHGDIGFSWFRDSKNPNLLFTCSTSRFSESGVWTWTTENNHCCICSLWPQAPCWPEIDALQDFFLSCEGSKNLQEFYVPPICQPLVPLN